MRPYYSDGHVTIYHADCQQLLPSLGKFDLLLTDPPYGIGMDKGASATPARAFRTSKKVARRRYAGEWDKSPPETQALKAIIDSCGKHIVWGGNYFMGALPPERRWLVWDKMQTMPTFSDAELAWSSLPGVSVKMFRYNGNGLCAKEKNRVHPTQKPLALMIWCISLAGNVQTILDPFAGSGTTGRAAKDLGKRPS